MTPSNPAARTRALPVLTLLLSAGCGAGDPADDRLTAAVDTVEGVETLSYAASPAPALPWRLDTVAVLGDAFAEDEYQFNDVTPDRLAGGGAGDLYVLDAQGDRLLRYSPTGRHLATYGRPGEGPGELSQPMGVAVGPGDTAWVSDFSNSRVTGYPADGGDPRSLPLPESGAIPGARMAVLDGGFLMVLRPLFAFGRGGGGAMAVSRPGGDEDAEVQTLPLVRLDADFQPADTLWTTPEPPMDMVRIETGDRMMVSLMSRELWPELQWAAFRDGRVVVNDTAAYLLRFLEPGGRVARVILRDPAPRAATEADREAIRQRVRDRARNEMSVRVGGAGPGEELQQRMLEQRLEQMTFADLVPRVVRLAVDPRGRLWAGVSEDTPDEVDRIDIFDGDGRLLGELRDFPFPDVFVDAAHVGVLRRDDMDVQQVVLLRLDEGRTAAGG